MASRTFSTAAILVLAAGLLGACGGNVSTTNGGEGGEGGDGGEGGASSSSVGGATSSSSTSTGGAIGGTGGAIGGTGGTSTGGTGGASDCAAFDQVGCLAAYPSCVPIYDDACCPSCDPGPCADCINLQFHHCAPVSEGCGSAPVPCGFAPDWACAGGQADCDIPPEGPSPALCGTVAGCIPGYCNLDIDCTTDPVCVPVTAATCGPILCDAVPPPCPDGTSNEAQNGCFTSLCIPGSVCQPTK